MEVAVELIDGALADASGDDYRALVAELDGVVRAYVCYGPTPMTDGAFDLDWIATHPDARGRGCASALVRAMEAELRTEGGRLVRVETSTTDGYGAAHRFYERHHYPEIGRIADFYKPGDDLIILAKHL